MKKLKKTLTFLLATSLALTLALACTSCGDTTPDITSESTVTPSVTGPSADYGKISILGAESISNEEDLLEALEYRLANPYSDDEGKFVGFSISVTFDEESYASIEMQKLEFKADVEYTSSQNEASLKIEQNKDSSYYADIMQTLSKNESVKEISFSGVFNFTANG